MQRIRVYIDGFNLYHGIIRESRTHWLDLNTLAERLNRGGLVEKILYCTAMVSSTALDPEKAQRQETYHRALAVHCPNIEIIKGQFTSHKKFQPLAKCSGTLNCLTRVVVRNEKGSDVNLASRLLHDAHLNRFDKAIVISGDSDLREPIRLVTQEIGKLVWVRNPRDVDSQELRTVSTDYGRLRPGVLIQSQLPEEVGAGVKTYRKPPEWSSAALKLARTEVTAMACSVAGCGQTIKTYQLT